MCAPRAGSPSRCGSPPGGQGRQEELEAFGVAAGRAAALVVHVATADPGRARRHADLVARAVVAGDCAGDVGAVAEVVAGDGRVGALGRCPHRAVPVVGMIGCAAVPAAIAGHEGRMVPDHPGILHAHHNPCAAHAVERPNLRRAHEANAPLRAGRAAETALHGQIGQRRHASHARVGRQAGHVAALRQRQQQPAIPRHRQHVDQIVRCVGDAASIQPAPQRLLAAQGGLAQGIIDPLPPAGRIGQPARGAQIGLLGQDHQKAGRLAGGGGRPQLRRDLRRLGRSRAGRAAQRDKQNNC
jgi:hypothetical protein